jgi:hypothetical protein
MNLVATSSDQFHRVVFDARLNIELQEGYLITLLFATEDVVNKWPPMLLPDLPGLAEKVRDEMETEKIGVNFVIKKSTSSVRQKSTGNAHGSSPPDES